MTASQLRQTLDRDLDSRYHEIDEIRRAISPLLSFIDQERRRRPLLLLLYAHLEGFCVFALREYVKAVNLLKISCAELHPDLLAGAWSSLFNAINAEEKCDLFGKALTDDSKLHKHWRRRQFVKNLDHSLSQPVTIPSDTIRSDSNLTAAVLMRNLFMVGLPHTFVAPFEDTIKELLGRRNAIAHGQDTSGIRAVDYKRYEDCFQEVTGRLLDYLVEAIEAGQYQRSLSIGWPPGL